MIVEKIKNSYKSHIKTERLVVHKQKDQQHKNRKDYGKDS